MSNTDFQRACRCVKTKGEFVVKNERYETIIVKRDNEHYAIYVRATVNNPCNTSQCVDTASSPEKFKYLFVD